MSAVLRNGTRTVTAAISIMSASMLVFGFWAWLAPRSFADLTNFPVHVHFLHDAGVFQIGIGVMLLTALRWRDALTVVLIGFLTANTLHAVNHAVDLDQGGHLGDVLGLAGLSVIAAVALYLHLHTREQSDRLEETT